MARKELRPYHESGSGVVEIGSFRLEAEWEETGRKSFNDASNHGHGGYWVEDKLPDNVTLRIDFGRLSPSDSATLYSALFKAEHDPKSPISITLNGKPYSLYLNDMDFADDKTPRVLVFSNRRPRKRL